MRILLASLNADGAWFVWLLNHQGHQVDWTVGNDDCRHVLEGLIPTPLDHLDPAAYDLVVFDMSGNGADADEVRKVTPVIGASALADKLEHDREFGLEFMERAGIPVPPWQVFDDVADGIRYVRKVKKRVVFKPCGEGDDSSCTYVAKSPEDMERYLEVLFKRIHVKRFVMQEFIAGTEVSTEAWFNGEEWFALNHTLEEKKFMSGGIGPNTGCAGNLCWMPLRSNSLFERGLMRAAPLLKEAGFVGMLDLNTIVTEGNLFGLEWTPRFGYEGTCNLTRLLPMDFGDFLYAMAAGGSPVLGPAKHPFAATIRLSVPPYPTNGNLMKVAPSEKQFAGIPVSGLDPDNLECWYVCDMRLVPGSENELEMISKDGLVGAPIGVGDSVEQAFKECQIAIDKLLIPDLQYRNDVARCCSNRYETLLSQGWLRTTG